MDQQQTDAGPREETLWTVVEDLFGRLLRVNEWCQKRLGETPGLTSSREHLERLAGLAGARNLEALVAGLEFGRHPALAPQWTGARCGDGQRPGCGSEVVWALREDPAFPGRPAKDREGKAVRPNPITAMARPDGNVVFTGPKLYRMLTEGERNSVPPPGQVRYVSHFTDCPLRTNFQKRGGDA